MLAPTEPRSYARVRTDRASRDEYEKLRHLGSVAEAHANVSEVVFKLRRELPPKSPVVKAAVKVERELFQLKRQLQQLDVDGAPVREPLAEVRRGGTLIDLDELGRDRRE